MATLPLVALLTFAMLQEGQPAPETNRTWLVAYEEAGDLMTRMLMGTLEITPDHELRYRSLSRDVTWAVRLEDITATHIESVQGPARQVNAIVIDSIEKGQVVRKRLAPMNWDLTFLTPGPLAKLIAVRVEEKRSGKGIREQ